MPLMEWDKSMSVGVGKLDAQHQKLIDLINESYAAIQTHDEQALGVLIGKMRDYADMHFATEEGYLQKYEYPDIEGHKFHHAKFNHDVDEFQRNIYEKTNLSQIFVYLSRWLTNHIMEEDRKYTKYMPREEVAPEDGSRD